MCHFYIDGINCSQITDVALTNVSPVACIALAWHFRANVSLPLRLCPEINHAAAIPPCLNLISNIIGTVRATFRVTSITQLYDSMKIECLFLVTWWCWVSSKCRTRDKVLRRLISNVVSCSSIVVRLAFTNFIIKK